MSKYTAGPWIMGDDEFIIGAKGELVADPHCDSLDPEERAANAALIAAAPELLEACRGYVAGVQNTLEMLPDGDPVCKFLKRHKGAPVYEAIKAAIAKVEGK